MSTTTETVTRPPRAPAASVILTATAVVCALLLAPVTSAAAAEPLPTGTYAVSVGSGEVTIEVAPDGAVQVAASDGFVVRLAFDEDGRVLDEFTVSTDSAQYEVEVEVEDDGTYASDVRQRVGDEPTGDHGEVVSTVARCAPAGMVAGAVGLPNHGTIVSAAASGLAFAAEVTDPVTGEVTTVEADFSTTAGAEDFCAQVDAAVPTLDEVRETLEAEAAAAQAARASAAQERAAAQAANARARAAERAAQRAAERAAGRGADHASGPGRPGTPNTSRGSAGGDRSAADEDGGQDGTRAAEDVTDTTDGDGGASTDETTDTATDTGGSTTDDGTTADDTTADGSTEDGTADQRSGPGQGGGKPAAPGENGRRPDR